MTGGWEEGKGSKKRKQDGINSINGETFDLIESAWVTKKWMELLDNLYSNTLFLFSTEINQGSESSLFFSRYRKVRKHFCGSNSVPARIMWICEVVWSGFFSSRVLRFFFLIKTQTTLWAELWAIKEVFTKWIYYKHSKKITVLKNCDI